MIQQITYVGHPEVEVAAAAVAASLEVQCTGLLRISAYSLLWADGTIILTNGNGAPPATSQLVEEADLDQHPTVQVDAAAITDGKTAEHIHEWICRNDIELLNIIGERGPSLMADLHTTLFIIRGVILEGLRAAYRGRG